MFISWLIQAVAIIITALIVPGIHIQSFITALVLAIVLGIINAILKPIILFFTLPLTILTLGLFTFVINAFLILLASHFVPGFKVDGFFAAFLFSIILSLVNSLLGKFVK